MIAAIRCIATAPKTYENLAWSLIKMVPKDHPLVDTVVDTYRNSSLKIKRETGEEYQKRL